MQVLFFLLGLALTATGVGASCLTLVSLFFRKGNMRVLACFLLLPVLYVCSMLVTDYIAVRVAAESARIVHLVVHFLALSVATMLTVKEMWMEGGTSLTQGVPDINAA